MSASSEWNIEHGARCGRLENTRDDCYAAAWAVGAGAPQTATNNWLQVDLGWPRVIVGAMTQGRDNYTPLQCVSSYVLQYSNTTTNFVAVSNSFPNNAFPGNTDQDTVVTNFLTPTLARYWRFVPKTYINHQSMRVELLECLPPLNETTSACAQGIPLGMESNDIPESSLTASSSWPPTENRIYTNYGPQCARLNQFNRPDCKLAGGADAWAPNAASAGQWIQAGFRLVLLG